MRPVLLTSTILALTLVLTLGAKIAFDPGRSTSDGALQQGQVIAFLERQGFLVGPPLPDVGPSMVPAQRPGCSLRVSEISPFGWHRDVLAQLTRPDERLFFVFRGKSASTQPVWQTFADYNWSRLQRYVGLQPPERPVLGVIASADCGSLELPWSEVAEFH
jgi:hypothetical protein